MSESFGTVAKILIPSIITLLLTLIASSISYGKLSYNVSDIETRLKKAETQLQVDVIDSAVNKQIIIDTRNDVIEIKADLKELLKRR